MTFFIPERTNCRLCGRPIAKRIDAVQLDWVHPEDMGELAQFGRSFVHHDCWQTWEHRQTFTAAARALRRRAVDEKPVIERDGVFLYQRGADLAIEDVVPPISLSISATENPQVPEWLIGVISEPHQNANTAPQQLVIGMHSLAALRRGDELAITLAYDGEDIQRFTLSAARQSAWLTVLQTAVLRRSHRESG